MDEDQAQLECRPALLFAFANDQRPGRRLDRLGREIEEIRRALAEVERGGLCEVVVRESTTPAELVEVLEDPRLRRRLTVLHFAGHAGGSKLLLEGEHGPIAARIQGLGPLLGELEGLALVFLNGCGTVAQGERILKTGIPAVIATDHAVGDEQAKSFAVDFYRGLAGGASISEGFAHALAHAQCFVDSPGPTRDIELGPPDELATHPWRLLLADPHGDAKDWGLVSAASDPLFGLPIPVGRVLPQEPFMGLRRFTARESAVFFGRGQAIRNLYRDVVDPAIPPLVVVYGASGVGKSSLLEAGLLPRVAAGCEVHDLRLERGQDPELVLRHALGYSTGEIDLAAAWQAREHACGRPVVICLDQLEVLVLEPGGRKVLARLVQTISALVGLQRPRGKLLLGLRKEWFPELRAELKRRRVQWHEHFVEPLGRGEIEEVVLGPTRTASLRARFGISCESGLARRIADDLSQDPGAAIAPMLQILLTRMWKHTEPRQNSVAGRMRRRFALDTYDQLRREGLALSDFVERQLDALHTTHADALASGLVLDLLFGLTTSRGTAASRDFAELREIYAHRWRVVEELVERCSSLYLLQVCTDARGVEVGVRLAHDTLAPVVRDQYRRSKALGQAAARLLETRMGLSEVVGRSRLLDEHDLAQVEAAQPGMRRWSAEEERLVVQSRQWRRRSVWLRRWRLVVMVASVAVAVVAMTVRSLESGSSSGMVDRLSVAAPAARQEMGSEHGRAQGRATCMRRLLATEITAKSAKIQTMVVTDDGTRVALGMESQPLAFVFKPHGEAMLTKLTTQRGVNHLAWNPEEDILAIGQEKGGVQVVRWDTEDEHETIECLGHMGSIKALAFSGDGSTLSTADEDGEVISWDGWKHAECRERARASLGSEAYALHPQLGSWLVVGAKGRLLSWSTTRPETFASVSKGDDTIRRVEPGPLSPWVLLAGTHLRTWNPHTDELAFDHKLALAAYWVFVVGDGKAVLTISTRTVDLWRLDDDMMATRVNSLDIPDIVGAAVPRDGGDALIADASGSVHWLELRGGGAELTKRRSLVVSDEKLSTIVVDPSLRYFAVGDHKGRVSLVELPAEREDARICQLNDVQRAKARSH